jgi:PAS domain S-box-containing protein
MANAPDQPSSAPRSEPQRRAAQRDAVLQADQAAELDQLRARNAALEQLVAARTTAFQAELDQLRADNAALEQLVAARATAFQQTVDALEREVAERERIERALRFSQHFSVRVADLTPASIYVYDFEQNRNIYINREVTAVLGYPVADVERLSGGEIAAYIHPEDQAQLNDFPTRVRQWNDGVIYARNVRVRAADGTWHWFETRESVFARDTNGVPSQVLGISIDITAIKHAEQQSQQAAHMALLRAEINEAINRPVPLDKVLDNCARLFVSYLEVAFARIWLFNPDTNVLELDASAGLYTHLDGQHSRIPLGTRKIGRIARDRQPLLTNDLTADPSIGDPDWARATGIVSFAGHPLLADDRLIGVVGMFGYQPITQGAFETVAAAATVIALGIERRRARAALVLREHEIRQLNNELEQRVRERTAALELANKELESFSYSVSHDLRAPLRAIDGFSRAMIEDYADCVDSQGLRYLQRICAGTQRMSQLIDELLNLARVARTDLRARAVDLSQIALQTVAELRQAEPARQVVVTIAPEMHTIGDEYLLRIVIENLIGNAWKFTAHRAQAEIAFFPQQIGDQQVFVVRDNGAGFDMTYVDKLFGAFQRLHSTHEFPGTGIGLATVQRIIHRHGGRVWAHGEIDQGALFTFTLGRALH